LERYIEKNLPVIKTPLDLKQVGHHKPSSLKSTVADICHNGRYSSVSVSQTQRTYSRRPMARSSSCARSRRANFCPRQHTWWSGSIRLFMRSSRQMFRYPRRISYVKTTVSWGHRSTSWNSWMGECLRILPFLESVPKKDLNCTFTLRVES
jgi:hypothetical protein